MAGGAVARSGRRDAAAPAIEGRPDFFDYAPDSQPAPNVAWHLNFADTYLFCAYGGGLFAQDEMQVAEHPSLASLREALLRDGKEPLTKENGRPTPCLITGVERRCHVRTEPDPSAGRPQGLYGNRFRDAPGEAIEQATEVIDPPTRSNIIAIAAPSPGYGKYSREQIVDAFATAYSGFAAARHETNRLAPEGAACIVHTGHWGCGAFGGHRVLMALLQLLAARLANVSKVVFHGGDEPGLEPLASARDLLDELLAASAGASNAVRLTELIDRIVAMDFVWGVSDGN